MKELRAGGWRSEGDPWGRPVGGGELVLDGGSRETGAGGEALRCAVRGVLAGGRVEGGVGLTASAD